MSRNRRHNRYGNPGNSNPVKPQDHKPASGKPRIITVKGIDVQIDPRKLDDWELFEAASLIQQDPEKNAYMQVEFLQRLFGDEEYRRIKDALRNPDGRLPGTRMSGFLEAMFEQLGDLNPNS